jgi:uncharacterized protein
MKLILEFDSNANDFLNKAAGLFKNPTLHSFLLSLAAKYKEKHAELFVRGTDESGAFRVAGLQTDFDRALIMSNASSEDAETFANLLSEKVQRLPGVMGPVPAVDSFAKTWSTSKSCKSHLSANQRLFELTKLKPPRPIQGFWRLANPYDLDLLFHWRRAFHDEAVPHDPKPNDEELRDQIREHIEQKSLFIWQDGAPVCFVGSTRETAAEKWIAPVYTPPALRGKGYGTALVAAVSDQILQSGKKGMLFTDLANPTSNSIYQKIGYVPVADFKHILFEKPKKK